MSEKHRDTDVQKFQKISNVLQERERKSIREIAQHCDMNWITAKNTLKILESIGIIRMQDSIYWDVVPAKFHYEQKKRQDDYIKSLESRLFALSSKRGVDE